MMAMHIHGVCFSKLKQVYSALEECVEDTSPKKLRLLVRAVDEAEKACNFDLTKRAPAIKKVLGGRKSRKELIKALEELGEIIAIFEF